MDWRWKYRSQQRTQKCRCSPACRKGFLWAVRGKNLRMEMLANTSIQISSDRTSLVVPWLRIQLSMQGTQVQSFVWNDSMWHGATKPMHHDH